MQADEHTERDALLDEVEDGDDDVDSCLMLAPIAKIRVGRHTQHAEGVEEVKLGLESVLRCAANDVL